jgi:hypothetical protein
MTLFAHIGLRSAVLRTRALLKPSGYWKIAVVPIVLLSLSNPAFAQKWTASVSAMTKCAGGIALATYTFGRDEYKSEKLSQVVDMAQNVCVTDTLVLSLYNAFKGGDHEKSLAATRGYAEHLVKRFVTRMMGDLKKRGANSAPQPVPHEGSQETHSM